MPKLRKPLPLPKDEYFVDKNIEVPTDRPLRSGHYQHDDVKNWVVRADEVEAGMRYRHFGIMCMQRVVIEVRHGMTGHDGHHNWVVIATAGGQHWMKPWTKCLLTNGTF